MKQVYQVARNIRLVARDHTEEGEQPLYPMVEIALTLGQKDYQFVGQYMQGVEKLTTERFELLPSAARDLAANLIEYASQADAAFEAACGEKFVDKREKKVKI